MHPLQFSGLVLANDEEITLVGHGIGEAKETSVSSSQSGDFKQRARLPSPPMRATKNKPGQIAEEEVEDPK